MDNVKQQCKTKTVITWCVKITDSPPVKIHSNLYMWRGIDFVWDVDYPAVGGWIVEIHGVPRYMSDKTFQRSFEVVPMDGFMGAHVTTVYIDDCN